MITVIIPSRNEEKYIAACINSLKNQTIKSAYEVIVVDSSSDKTKEILKGFDVKVVDFDKAGSTGAKNLGAKNAAGDILCFVDADCIAPNTHLEKIENIFNKNPKLDAIGGPCIYLDGGFLIKFFTKNLRYFYFYHKLLSLILGYPTLPGGNTVIKKSAFDKSGGFDENLQDIVLPEDIDFSLIMHKNGLNVKLINSLEMVTSYRRFYKKSKKDALTRFTKTLEMLRRGNV